MLLPCLWWLLSIAMVTGLKDYWNMFCGKGVECYSVLGLTRVSPYYLLIRDYGSSPIPLWLFSPLTCL